MSYEKRLERHERIVEFVQKQAKKELRESGGNDFVTHIQSQFFFTHKVRLSTHF
jgi:hypothetical protein